MTTLVVLQPGYLPWLGAIEQLHRSDIFVVYDDVQYDKGGWRNRNRIRTPTAQGWSWLTVPVRREHLSRTLVLDVLIDDHAGWRQKHWRSLRLHYEGTKGWSKFGPQLRELYAAQWERIVDLDLATFELLAAGFGIRRTVRRSSTLRAAGHKTARLIQLAQEVGADSYYSGAAARDYLDVDAMRTAGINVTFQDFRHPVYVQRYEPFVPFLSAIDLLLNHGSEGLGVLVGGGQRQS